MQYTFLILTWDMSIGAAVKRGILHCIFKQAIVKYYGSIRVCNVAYSKNGRKKLL